MSLRRRSLCVWAGAGPAWAQPVPPAEPLRVHWMFSSGSQRDLWVRIARRYEDLGRPLESREREQAQYKAEFDALLRQQPAAADVAFWFGGQRLREFVDQDLLEPLDDLARGWESQFHPAMLDAVRVQGRVWALPLATYQWGFYYRRSVFERLHLQPPATWEAWLHLNEQLRGAGLAPIVMGSREGWPLGAWFDYFNLRLHGKAFHAELLSGRASWLDARVRAVFERWRQLLQRGDFLPGSFERDWRQALPYVTRGHAGMVLMGNFVSLAFPAAVRPDLGFFPFPTLDARVPLIEDAPLDVLVIPRAARQKAAAREFLRYLARPELQAELNQAMGLIPPHRGAAVGSDPLAQAGARLLARAAGSMQFFDRDAPAAFSAPALEWLARFEREPANLEPVLRGLEALRMQVWPADNPRR